MLVHEPPASSGCALRNHTFGSAAMHTLSQLWVTLRRSNMSAVTAAFSESSHCGPFEPRRPATIDWPVRRRGGNAGGEDQRALQGLHG